MTELLSLLLLISCQNCTFAYQLHLFLNKDLVLKTVISKLKQFMPVLRKPGSHKTAFRQTTERYSFYYTFAFRYIIVPVVKAKHTIHYIKRGRGRGLNVL